MDKTSNKLIRNQESFKKLESPLKFFNDVDTILLLQGRFAFSNRRMERNNQYFYVVLPVISQF